MDDVNKRDGDGNTALSLAANKVNLGAIKYLLNNGANKCRSRPSRLLSGAPQPGSTPNCVIDCAKHNVTNPLPVEWYNL